MGKVIAFVCFMLSHTVFAATISYQQTYPSIPLSDTLIGLDFITQLQPTQHGTAYANGTESLPNTDAFMVFDRQSNVYKVNGDGSQSVLLDTKSAIGAGFINNNSQRGLQYAVAHPDFGQDGATGEHTLYTTTTESINPDTNATLLGLPSDLGLTTAHYDVVSEWDLSGDTPVRSVLVVMETPRGDHNTRWLGFGPDGNLYISVGDGGNTYYRQGQTVAQYGFGQRTDSPLGSILRIGVAGDGTYSIPNDNPYVGQSGVVQEIFANGLRNPQDCWWSQQGQLYCSDIGQRLAEEVNQIQSGGNYGWNIREGEYCVVADNQDLAGLCPPSNQFIDPVFAYAHLDHSGGLENRAIGGVALCEGCGIDALEGYILATDLASGAFFGFNQSTQQLYEFLFQDLVTKAVGSYSALMGLTRVEARIGACGDGICYSSRRDDNVFRLINAVDVPAPAGLVIVMALAMFYVGQKQYRRR